MKNVIFFIMNFWMIFQVNSVQFYSENGQDMYVYENFFKDQRSGFFVDIGANNGISHSNTYFFEKNCEWSGICFEPNPLKFIELKKNRECICIPKGVSDRKGFFTFISHDCHWVSGFLDKYTPTHYKKWQVDGQLKNAIKVETVLLNDVLKQHNFKDVDFLSIDTEGGELEILKSIDYSEYNIRVIVVENIYMDNKFREFLESKGYQYVTRIYRDEVYVK